MNSSPKTVILHLISVRNHKKYVVKFEGQAEPGINWEFKPVEQQVIIGPSETAIVFYRLYNK
jgi:cytochrome c oxidase assembly protein Cox11